MTIRGILAVALRVVIYPLIGWVIYSVSWPKDSAGRDPYFEFVMLTALVLVFVAWFEFSAKAIRRVRKSQVDRDRRAKILAYRLKVNRLVSVGDRPVSMNKPFRIAVEGSPYGVSFLVRVSIDTMDSDDPVLEVVGYPQKGYGNYEHLWVELAEEEASNLGGASFVPPELRPQGGVANADS